MNEKQQKSAESVVDCLLQLQELTGSEGNYAYRGQKNAEWKVESGASRRLNEEPNPQAKKTTPSKEKEDFISYHEKELLEPARMDGYGDGEDRPLYDLELLAKLQHHGAATCLIDFTRNFLVAMWFACRPHKEKEKGECKEIWKDGKIFILNTSDEKNFLSLEEEDLKKEVRPILKFQTRDDATSSKEETPLFLSMLKPSWWHWSPQGLLQRILKQDSLFIFGQIKIEKRLLQEIEIKHEHKDKIIEELERLGITERTLFKDLPGFAESHDYNKSLPRGYGTPKYHLRKGNEALQRDDFKGAMADYNQVIELEPNFAEAYKKRGQAKSNLGDLNGAIADLDRAIELMEINIDKHPVGAIAELDRAIELDPELAVAYYNRGNIKFSLGEHNGAIADYDRAIEHKRDFAEAYNNRGNAKSNLGERRGAIADYDRAIEHKRDFAEAYNNRGIVKADDGDRSGAMADLDRAIELKPDDMEAYHNRGIVNRILGCHSEAIADFNRAIELKPDKAEVYNSRGVVKADLGNHKGAIADYNQAIKFDPDDAKAYFNRGNANRILGHNSGAIADYNRAIKLKPGYVEAYNNRGMAKSILGEYSEAIADFNRAIKLKPDDAKAYYNRGLACTSLGDKEKLEDKEMARRDLLKARELAEQNGDERLVRLCNEALSELDNGNNNSS